MGIDRITNEFSGFSSPPGIYCFSALLFSSEEGVWMVRRRYHCRATLLSARGFGKLKRSVVLVYLSLPDHFDSEPFISLFRFSLVP